MREECSVCPEYVWMYVCMYGWMDGCMDGWMYGWMDEVVLGSNSACIVMVCWIG